MEPLLTALKAVFLSGLRAGDSLRVPEPEGGYRILVPAAPHDPHIDHGFILPFCPPLDDTMGLEACHLRGRLLRTPDSIEAARAYAQGVDVDANAHIIAVEAAKQLTETWKPLANPVAWTGPGATFVLQSVNCAPADAASMVALLRAGAYGALKRTEEARKFLQTAKKSTEPRIRRACAALEPKFADA